MKTVVIIRHAKSSWENVNEIDFNRKLSKRGKKQISEMTEVVQKKLLKPDIIITSPAKRTKKTVHKFSKAIGFKKSRIVYDMRVYEADSKLLTGILHEIPESCNVLYLCGHNPSLSDFVMNITKTENVNIPTCGIYIIHLSIDSWKDEILGNGFINNQYVPSIFA